VSAAKKKVAKKPAKKAVAKKPAKKVAAKPVKKAAAKPAKKAVAKKAAPDTLRTGATLMPEELSVELARNPQAKVFFEQMPPSHQREYMRVVGEAKKAETRQKRAAAAIPMLLEWGAARARG
jgi:uncharacterized protein YdeI (YjbR/CyaY-like superfamily)